MRKRSDASRSRRRPANARRSSSNERRSSPAAPPLPSAGHTPQIASQEGDLAQHGGRAASRDAVGACPGHSRDRRSDGRVCCGIRVCAFDNSNAQHNCSSNASSVGDRKLEEEKAQKAAEAEEAQRRERERKEAERQQVSRGTGIQEHTLHMLGGRYDGRACTAHW